MFNWLSGNALWQLIRQSDTMSAFVLFALLCMSIVCWTVFLYKYLILQSKTKELSNVHEEMKGLRTIDQLLSLTSVHVHTLPGYYLSKVLVFLKIVLESREYHEGKVLSAHEWDMVQRHIDQTIDSVMLEQESYTAILSTSAAVGTLLGLFGTVWGLIHAFMSISEQQNADIATVAPGIAEALTTTLVGLIVAIPALIMFNVLQRKLVEMEAKLSQIADHAAFIVQRSVVQKGDS